MTSGQAAQTGMSCRPVLGVTEVQSEEMGVKRWEGISLPLQMGRLGSLLAEGGGRGRLNTVGF